MPQKSFSEGGQAGLEAWRLMHVLLNQEALSAQRPLLKPSIQRKRYPKTICSCLPPDELIQVWGSVDEERELAVCRLIIAGNCIYGVDLNPLAVDLAKLAHCTRSAQRRFHASRTRATRMKPRKK